MTQCNHKSLLEIKEDPITHIKHFICGECETDFGDVVLYIDSLHNKIIQLEDENEELKDRIRYCGPWD
jgi:hypothetical protein